MLDIRTWLDPLKRDIPPSPDSSPVCGMDDYHEDWQACITGGETMLWFPSIPDMMCRGFGRNRDLFVSDMSFSDHFRILPGKFSGKWIDLRKNLYNFRFAETEWNLRWPIHRKHDGGLLFMYDTRTVRTDIDNLYLPTTLFSDEFAGGCRFRISVFGVNTPSKRIQMFSRMDVFPEKGMKNTDDIMDYFTLDLVRIRGIR